MVDEDEARYAPGSSSKEVPVRKTVAPVVAILALCVLRV